MNQELPDDESVLLLGPKQDQHYHVGDQSPHLPEDGCEQSTDSRPEAEHHSAQH